MLNMYTTHATPITSTFPQVLLTNTHYTVHTKTQTIRYPPNGWTPPLRVGSILPYHYWRRLWDMGTQSSNPATIHVARLRPRHLTL